MIKESGIVERLRALADESTLKCWEPHHRDWRTAMLEAATLIAELQAERDGLRLRNANLEEQRDAHAARSKAAESSLHRVRGETIEECASLAENQVFAVLPDQMTTRELIKAQRNQIAASIRSLNITGLDTGAVKTAESSHSPSTLNAETE